MRIGFYAGSCLPVHAKSLEERPLGGTETGIVRMAEILAKRGHDVVVFSSMKDPPLSVPQYVPHGSIFQAGQFDIMVLIKEWKPAIFNVPASRLFFWTGDGFDQYINFGLGDKRVTNKIEKFLTASNWQAQSMCEMSGFPHEKTFYVGNGIHPPYFEGEEQRIRKRLIFSSAPYRGLGLMPQIFLMARERHPDIELHVFSGMNIYDTEQPYAGPQVEDYKRIASLLQRIPNVHLHGNVTQKALARELMKSSVYVYPNLIFETCCITAIEAQAAGCPAVASRNSGLIETVGNAGILIDHQPGSKEYLSEFTAAIDLLLTNDKLWEKYSRTALERVKRQYSWDHVADRFEQAML